MTTPEERVWNNRIEELIDLGVLGEKLPPENPDDDFSRWPILQPEKLPHWLQNDYKEHGEVRNYH